MLLRASNKEAAESGRESSGSTAPVAAPQRLRSCHCYNHCPEDSTNNTCRCGTHTHTLIHNITYTAAPRLCEALNNNDKIGVNATGLFITLILGLLYSLWPLLVFQDGRLLFYHGGGGGRGPGPDCRLPRPRGLRVSVQGEL